MPRRSPQVLLSLTFACALFLPTALALKYNQAVEEAVPAHDTARLRSGLEECWLREGTVFVRGWAYVEGDTGVRPIQVHATDAAGTSLRLPSRVERRVDIAEAAGRGAGHDAIHDGFTAGSSRVGRLAAPLTITLVRTGSDGQRHGARHPCG
jgi:hypothetical protein